MEEFSKNWDMDTRQLQLVIYVSASYKPRVLSSVELHSRQLPKFHFRSDFKNYLKQTVLNNFRSSTFLLSQSKCILIYILQTHNQNEQLYCLKKCLLHNLHRSSRPVQNNLPTFEGWALALIKLCCDDLQGLVFILSKPHT